MHFPPKLIISLQIQEELFTSMTLTSPYFSPSSLRKHAQTCHLHYSAFLTRSFDIYSPHNGLKQSPDPEVGGQVTSFTPSRTGMWTLQLITSPEVVWGWPLLCNTDFCRYKHKLKGVPQSHQLWGETSE